MAIFEWRRQRRRPLDGGGTRRRLHLFRPLYSRKLKRMILFAVVFLAIVPPLFFHFKLRRIRQNVAKKCDWLQHPPRVCAHGGDSTLAFPNTMDAYSYAIGTRVDCIEVDVSRSSDGVLFALHNRDLQRIARNSSVQVGDLSMKQIKELDVSQIVKGTLENRRIPTLEDALAAISTSVRQVILDAKVGPPMYEKGLALDILSVIEKARCKNCIVWAKSDSLARDLIRRAPDLTVGYIVMVDPLTGVRSKLLRMKGASVVGVYHPLIDENLMTVVHRRKKEVYAWTVDETDPMKRMLHLGVDAVVTSNPAMFQGLMEDLRTECLEEGFSIRT
ncbi:glycerophosphodiester phosphodiesterase GDPD4 [Brassica napus]|uniref:glycerophosphodiester phosphodiesterase GDPD4 n=1 Tax=Brassica napus TaxID=3708 RepID=UPI0006AA9614|nr:glycerophosphodiester phosphodiesterase GDPD4 [Brassica napus]